VVLATEDNSEIEIIPSVTTNGLRTADRPYTVTLQTGELYQVQATADLTGTRIRSLSGAPVAVFSGAQQADVRCDGGADSHVYDQNYPTSRWGQRYVVVPFAAKSFDVVRVLAAVDDTEVRLNCGAPQVLSAGEALTVEVSSVTEVTSSQPVAVAQVSRGGFCDQRQVDVFEKDEKGDILYGPFPTNTVTGDPSMVILPPSALTRSAASLRSVNEGSETLRVTPLHYVNVYLPDGGVLQVDGLDETSSLMPLSDGGLAGSLLLAPGDHTLLSDQALQAHAYGFDEFDAYTYHLGYDCQDCLSALRVPPPACE